MDLYQLIYSSKAAVKLDYAVVRAIQRIAADRNRAEGITGLLLFGNDSFLQVLEGERAAVNRIYRSIAHDPRHRDLEVLQAGAVPARLFGDWSMKLVGLDDPQTEGRRAILLRHTGSVFFAPASLSGPDSLRLLGDLADLERHLAA